MFVIHWFGNLEFISFKGKQLMLSTQTDHGKVSLAPIRGIRGNG